jgi:hypothetical protein
MDGEVTCLAESEDGIRWQRPGLGLHECRGSRDNNIVWADAGGQYLTHNFAPFLDGNPACRPTQRYKALAGMPLSGLVSADGVRWKLIRKQPIITDGAFDSQNVALWDPNVGSYVAWVRIFTNNVRAIARATSEDFLHWSASEELDFGDTAPEHLYTNSIITYPRAPHLYLGFPKRYVPGRLPQAPVTPDGLSDAVFMSSRDGRRWRRWQEAFIRPGLDPLNWVDRTNHVARGMIQTSPEELSLYVLECYQTPQVRIRRHSLRTDGFVSMNAPWTGGDFTTVPLRFSGRELALNYASSAAGSVRVELRDAANQPVPGFGLKDCEEIYGDHIERVVKWGESSDLTALQGRVMRLRFVMHDADLFAFRFK